jgi:hypothetical protein
MNIQSSMNMKKVLLTLLTGPALLSQPLAALAGPYVSSVVDATNADQTLTIAVKPHTAVTIQNVIDENESGTYSAVAVTQDNVTTGVIKGTLIDTSTSSGFGDKDVTISGPATLTLTVKQGQKTLICYKILPD